MTRNLKMEKFHSLFFCCYKVRRMDEKSLLSPFLFVVRIVDPLECAFCSYIAQMDLIRC